MGEIKYTKQQADDLIAEHDKILVRGNGEPSLQERWRQLTTGFESFKTIVLADMAERKEERKYYTRLFVGIIITNVVSLFGAVVYFMVRFAPVLDQIQMSKTP